MRLEMNPAVSRVVARAAFRTLAIICLLASASLVVPLRARAEIIWRMATEYPQNSVSGIGLATFAQAVATRTNETVTPTIAFDNKLKISAGDMPRAVQEHRIDGGDAFAGPLESFDPVFGLASLPFVVQSVEAAKAVNTSARPLYAKALAQRGLKLLYLTIWPSTGVWSERPLRTPDDLRALSIRTYDANSATVLRSVGAQADFLPFNEAIARVKAHTLNAILTSGDGGAGRKLWDDLRHFTPINYAIPISIAFVRADAFAALTAEQQRQIEDAAAETEKSQFALIVTRTAENYKQMRLNGVGIDDPAPAAVIAALKQGAAAPILAWRAKVPPEAIAVLDAAGRRGISP